MRKNVSVLSVIGKIVFYILLIAAVWTIIRWFWLSYDWFPMVKSDIPGFGVPFVLSLLVAFLLKHQVASANDKWENLVYFFVILSSLFIFVNAGFIAEDATTKVVSVDKLTDLSREEIRKANYVQVEHIEPDTTSYDYTADYYINESSRSADKIEFSIYQVCPLKDMKGVFVCSETKDEHTLGLINRFDERVQRWMSEFEYSNRGTIKHDAMTAHFFKVIHLSDNIEQYLEAASSYLTEYGDVVSAKKDVILLEISTPDRIDGYWNNVVIILVTLLVLMVILALIMGLTGGVSRSEYEESRRSSFSMMLDIFAYMSQKWNFLVLLPPLLMIGWGLYMIYNGYNPSGSNDLLFDESGACTPDSLLVYGEWWRIITSVFIHNSFMHIFGNMMGYGVGAYALTHYLYGRDISLVFLISGALSIAFAVLYSQHCVIGASGGVFGLYGAFMVLFLLDSLWGKRNSERPIMWFGIIVVILAINFVTGFRSDISMSGHVSGFVVGAGVACILWLVYHFYDAFSKKRIR